MRIQGEGYSREDRSSDGLWSRSGGMDRSERRDVKRSIDRGIELQQRGIRTQIDS